MLELTFYSNTTAILKQGGKRNLTMDARRN